MPMRNSTRSKLKIIDINKKRNEYDLEKYEKVIDNLIQTGIIIKILISI